MFGIQKFFALVRNPENWIYALGVVTVIGLSTGAFAQSGNLHGKRGAQSAIAFERATDIQAREVKVEAHAATCMGGAAAGASLGGALGAILGHNSNNAQMALGISGAVLEGLGGHAAAVPRGGITEFEYIDQKEGDGRHPGPGMGITQPEPGPEFMPLIANHKYPMSVIAYAIF